MRRTRTQSGGLGVCCAQRFIVRIIFMVPLYSLLSFLSLLMEQNSVYFATFRDWCARARARLGSCCCEGVRRLFELAAAALLLLTCARTAPQCSSVFCSAFQHSTAQRTALKVQRPLAARAALQRGSAKRRPRNKDHALHDRRRLSSVRGPRARSYEAFVVYTFLALCLAYVGGPGSVEAAAPAGTQGGGCNKTARSKLLSCCTSPHTGRGVLTTRGRRPHRAARGSRRIP